MIFIIFFWKKIDSDIDLAQFSDASDLGQIGLLADDTNWTIAWTDVD